VGDYDSRGPLHTSCAEGRVLAVSFLLGISADPNQEDRWNNTPMDDALRGIVCLSQRNCESESKGSREKARDSWSETPQERQREWERAVSGDRKESGRGKILAWTFHVCYSVLQCVACEIRLFLRLDTN